MSRSSQNRRPDKNKRGIFGLISPPNSRAWQGGRGTFGPTSPSGSRNGGSKSNSSGTAGASRAGEILAPPQAKKGPGSGSATSKKNNDGDLFTRKSPLKRPRNFPPF